MAVVSITGPNDLALAQTPSGDVRDSENNQAAQTAETGKEGGCCQQRLVRPFIEPSETVSEYVSPFSLRYHESCRVIPWLNLLWLDKSLARSRGQSRQVSLPLVPRYVYDKLAENHLLEKVKAKLQQLYPDSFLFSVSPELLEVSITPPLPVSPTHLVEMCQQILSVRSLDEIEGEMNLAVAAHKIWLRTQGHSLCNTTNWGLAHDYDKYRQEKVSLEYSCWANNYAWNFAANNAPPWANVSDQATASAGRS